MIVQVKNIIPTTKKFLEVHIVEGCRGFEEIGAGMWNFRKLKKKEEKNAQIYTVGAVGGEQNYYISSHKSEPALHISKIRALIT